MTQKAIELLTQIKTMELKQLRTTASNISLSEVENKAMFYEAIDLRLMELYGVDTTALAVASEFREDDIYE